MFWETGKNIQFESLRQSAVGQLVKDKVDQDSELMMVLITKHRFILGRNQIQIFLLVTNHYT